MNTFCPTDKEFKLPNPPKYMESYVKLASDRVIFLSEILTKDVASDISATLLYYDAMSEKEDIFLYIHCNGGDAAGLLNIYDVMQMIKAPISTICIGKAYSAGAILLAAGTKGKRFAFKHSSVLLHGMQCMFPLLGHDTQNSKTYYDFLKNSNDNVLKIIAKHTGNSIEVIREDLSRDFILDAKRAKEYGVIDDIL